jgi:ribosomal protein S18 acetylase RimI-like enzyme
MIIREIKIMTDEVMLAFNRLLPQLSDKANPKYSDIVQVIESDSTYLFVAEIDGEIVGTLTLVTYSIPTGRKASIEDVVVDYQIRGKGIGRKLTEYAIEFAISIEVNTIELTSSPLREKANKLYKKIGFRNRDTNVYRLEL